MKRTKKLAARLMALCGLALIAWPAWELCVRIDAMIGPLRMFVRMAVGEGVDLWRAAAYVDWAIFAAPALLCVYIAFGTVCIARRRRGGAPLCLLALAMGLHMFYREAFFLPQAVRMLQLLPFAGACVGCALNMLVCVKERRAPKRPPRPKAFPLKQKNAQDERRAA